MGTFRDISIRYDNVKDILNKLDASADKLMSEYNTAISSIEATITHSQGDFVDRLKEELKEEKAYISSYASFIKTMNDYIQKATDDFRKTDKEYSDNKVEERGSSNGGAGKSR